MSLEKAHSGDVLRHRNTAVSTRLVDFKPDDPQEEEVTEKTYDSRLPRFWHGAEGGV